LNWTVFFLATMTRRAIVGKAFASAIAIAIGADATRGVKRKSFGSTIRKHDSDGHVVSGFNRKNSDRPELLEYFQNVDVTSEEERRLPYPFSHVKDSTLQDLNDQISNMKGKRDNNGTLSSKPRRLWSSNEKREDDEEDTEKEYSNYVKEETHEHYEELITADDDESIDVDDDDEFLFPSSTFPPTHTFTTFPTSSPTQIGSSFWDGIDEYEQSHFDDDQFISESEDYADNRINVRLALGVVHYREMSDDDHMTIVDMALSCITKILNDHSDIPFRVHDMIGKYHHREKRERNLVTAGFGFGGAQVEAKPEVQEREDLYLADLILEDVEVHLGHHNWWQIRGIYSVWKRPNRNSFLRHDYTDNYDEDKDWQKEHDRELHSREPHSRGLKKPNEQQQRRRLGIPVKNESILITIEGICNHAIEQAIDSGVYWKALHEIEFMDENLVLDNGIFYIDDKGMVDAQPVGEEYDMSEIFCPIERPKDGTTMTCPEDVNVAWIGDSLLDDAFHVPADFESNVIRDGTSDATYPRVIAESFSEIEWGDREWVGLALMTSTIVWTIILSVSAHLIFKKRKTQVLWGRALTPTGVDDILKVGWRVYEQPQLQQPPVVDNLQEQIQPQLQQPQLFLQIYDKGQGPGYNDENSMLKGGVEQQIFAPPAVAVARQDPQQQP